MTDQTPPNSKLNPKAILALSNCIMDYQYRLNPLRLQNLNMMHGNTILVDIDEQLEKLKALESSEIVNTAAGGSMCNSAVTASQFFADAHNESLAIYGVVGADAQGLSYEKDLVHCGILPLLKSIPDKETGSCIVVLTPDGERSMSTCLGANADFKLNNIAYEKAKISDILTIEGYLMFSQDFATDLLELISELEAEESRPEIWLTLGAANVVDTSREQFISVVPKCDLVCGNYAEVYALLKALEPSLSIPFGNHALVLKNVVKILAPLVKHLVVTNSEDGAMKFSFEDGKVVNKAFPATPLKVVDPLGAGDAFFGGLLGSYSIGNDLDKAITHAIDLGSLCTQHLGPRLGEEVLSEYLSKLD